MENLCNVRFCHKSLIYFFGTIFIMIILLIIGTLLLTFGGIYQIHGLVILGTITVFLFTLISPFMCYGCKNFRSKRTIKVTKKFYETSLNLVNYEIFNIHVEKNLK